MGLILIAWALQGLWYSKLQHMLRLTPVLVFA